MLFKKHYSKPFALWLLSWRTSSEIDDKAVKGFVDEDDFIITLDYNEKMGVCSIVLQTSSWRMVLEFLCLVLYFAKKKDIVYIIFVHILVKLTVSDVYKKNTWSDAW